VVIEGDIPGIVVGNYVQSNKGVVFLVIAPREFPQSFIFGLHLFFLCNFFSKMGKPLLLHQLMHTTQQPSA
jgi:hypothetical protein